MKIYDSKIWTSDLNEEITILPELKELAGKSIMITGCTGLVCSAVVDIIIYWNETHEEKIKVIAASRSKKKVTERFSPYVNKEWFVFVPYDAISTTNQLTISCDYIIHGASNASPDKIVKEPVETMMSNIVGIKCLLDYAKEKGIKRLLYISTSEVYGNKEHDRPSKTYEYGGINLLNSRNSYSVGKCAGETLCASYYDEYGVESVIVRPGHIYGPTATKFDRRVSSVWAYAAAHKEDIIMKSDGSQLRSYCYCLDSATAILKILLKGDPIKAYNISNPESVINIREMAKIIAEFAGVELKTELPTDEEKKKFNPMSNSSLDSSELQSLGWKGLFNAKRGLNHTVRILKEISTI